MNYLAIVLSAVLLLGLAQAGSAERRFSDLSVGKMSVSFNSGGAGLRVSYGGVSVVRDSSLWVHNPTWTYHYYGLPHLKDDVRIADIAGGKEATITHRGEAFLGTERITVTEDRVSVEFTYKLTKDVADADMEYCFGHICAAPILGRAFKAVTEDGESREGVVPIRATSSELEKCLLVPKPIKKLTIDSRVGPITFEVTGHPGSIQFFDRRLSPYESADQQPVFWCGVLGTHLEFGKQYSQTITLSVEGATRKPVSAAAPRVDKVTARDRADLRSPSSGPVYLIPEPQEMSLTKGDFVLDGKTVIVVGDHAKAEDLRGANSFADELKLLYGIRPAVVRESKSRPNARAILVGEAAINKLLASVARAEGLRAPEKDEGYALKVTPKLVLVLGHDRQGSYYGMQTLKQLVKASPRTLALQGCSINDWPSLKFRGAHLFTGNRALPFHKKLIDRILSRFKMNHLILEVDQIKWASDPELAVDFSEDQADVSKEIDYANDHFMEVTPLLQSLGHCDWMFTNGKNRDLAENPEKPYSYCPSNPRIYDYVFKFYDETIKLFRNPKFVHIGHDEVVEPGGFPKHDECKKRGAEQIFVDDTLKVREHLARSGARIMMWGDMMLYKGDAPDAYNAKTPEQAKWIRDQLPKDVVITDWHYATGKPEEFKSIGIFTSEGHDTIASTWYTPANIEAFSKQAKNVGALGLLQTTWAGFNSNEDNLKHNFIQFTAMILAAEYAWNSGKTSLEHLPYRWDEEFRRQWDPKPVDRTPRRGFTLELSPLYNVSLADNDNATGWMGFGSQHDLSAAPTGEHRLSGDLFRLASANSAPSAIRLASSLDRDRAYPASVSIPINRKAHSLLFLQTCAWTDGGSRKVGWYRVSYADGSSEAIDLAYGVNTSSWLDQRSVNGATRVWEGRTADGQKAALQKLVWSNPHPDRKITCVEFASSVTEAGPVLLAVSVIE